MNDWRYLPLVYMCDEPFIHISNKTSCGTLTSWSSVWEDNKAKLTLPSSDEDIIINGLNTGILYTLPCNEHHCKGI